MYKPKNEFYLKSKQIKKTFKKDKREIFYSDVLFEKRSFKPINERCAPLVFDIVYA